MDGDVDADASTISAEEEAAAVSDPLNTQECADSFAASDEPKLYYTMWLKPFHINFGQLLTVYLQLKTHVDRAAMPSHFQDEELW